jgi:exopolyphosphatase/guanosine-5'-triphosphate,3'-diphosphate pyrophosphatase
METGKTVAVIDVGSNSVRLLVARELSTSAFEVVDEERFDARLGEGQAGGDITPAGLERGLKAISIMTEIARSHSPSSIVCVGTEALRRAPNAQEFIARARHASDIELRLLSAEEEAHAGFLGVINSTGMQEGHLLDIGGGSLELMNVRGRAVMRTQSVPLGAIYATERYFRNDPPSSRDQRALRKAVRQQLTVTEPHPVLFGTGGAVRNLARLVKLRRRYPLRRLHGFVIERRELKRITAVIAKATPDQRREMPGVNGNRTDILPAAAIVIDEVMDLTGATTLTVAGQGLREGLVWQELRPDGAVISNVRAASIAGLGRANGIDELTAEPAVSAAAQLFEATRKLHGLEPADLELLLSAARLAGVGMHIDYYNRDRHAEYLIHSGDLRGFDHREIILLAALVRWADSGTPDLSQYKAIVRSDDPRRAALLSALLGIARAIHRRSPSPVVKIGVRTTGSAVKLSVTGKAALDAEAHELERQQKRFESVFKTSLAVSVAVQSREG